VALEVAVGKGGLGNIKGNWAALTKQKSREALELSCCTLI